MSGARLHTLLPELTTRQSVMVVGAAVIDVIADAYALPWRGCDIELRQQSVNVGGCALNIAVALKRLGIEAGNALPLGQGVWAEIIRNRMAKEGLIISSAKTSRGSSTTQMIDLSRFSLRQTGQSSPSVRLQHTAQ